MFYNQYNKEIFLNILPVLQKNAKKVYPLDFSVLLAGEKVIKWYHYKGLPDQAMHFPSKQTGTLKIAYPPRSGNTGRGG